RLWGTSINYDELAKAIIVHPAILRALDKSFVSHAPMEVQNIDAQAPESVATARLLGVAPTHDPAGHPLAHAGMEHTYGYLFSVLKTSFGYKRARWVSGESERGFGLKTGL